MRLPSWGRVRKGPTPCADGPGPVGHQLPRRRHYSLQSVSLSLGLHTPAAPSGQAAACGANGSALCHSKVHRARAPRGPCHQTPPAPTEHLERGPGTGGHAARPPPPLGTARDRPRRRELRLRPTRHHFTPKLIHPPTGTVLRACTPTFRGEWRTPNRTRLRGLRRDPEAAFCRDPGQGPLRGLQREAALLDYTPKRKLSVEGSVLIFLKGLNKQVSGGKRKISLEELQTVDGPPALREGCRAPVLGVPVPVTPSREDSAWQGEPANTWAR